MDFERIVGFEWDAGNARKNDDKHDVSQSEAEQAFFEANLLVAPDARHSAAEPRLHALGTTLDGRLLHITFTLRRDGTLIRVISARDAHRKERQAMSAKGRSRARIAPERVSAEGSPMIAKSKPPAFKAEAEERAFWEAHDSSQLVDWSKGVRVRLPNLKPSTRSISLRLPVHTLERIKAAANARDVPYQSLIKVWLEEKLSA